MFSDHRKNGKELVIADALEENRRAWFSATFFGTSPAAFSLDTLAGFRAKTGNPESGGAFFSSWLLLFQGSSD